MHNYGPLCGASLFATKYKGGMWRNCSANNKSLLSSSWLVDNRLYYFLAWTTTYCPSASRGSVPLTSHALLRGCLAWVLMNPVYPLSRMVFTTCSPTLIRDIVAGQNGCTTSSGLQGNYYLFLHLILSFS